MNIVHELIKKGYTKYKIAKLIGCAYNTVSMWDRGIWKPSPKYLTALETLLGSTDAKT